MKKDKNEKTQEPSTNKYGEETKKKYNPVKKTFIILGICMAAIIGLIAVAAIVAVATGVWSKKPIQIQSLSFQTEFDIDGASSNNTVNVLDDFKIKINYLPENANVLDVDLKFVNGVGSDVLIIPEKVKAGQEITIKVKKDANGLNLGGEAILEAGTGLVKTTNNLKVFVDVPIPTDGLKLVSNFDGKEITSGSQNITFYVFTDPASAINPNTGASVDLAKAYKNISLVSGNPNSLAINSNGVSKTGFYCPDYIAHDHAPFLPTKTHTFNGQVIDLVSPIKYVEFAATAMGSTEVPIVVTAKALRTYSMETDYVSITDSKYVTSDGGVNRQLFFEDLSAYVQKYQSYIKADNRSFTYQNYSYESGADYIESITQTTAGGDSYIKINDNNPEYEAALFYMFVQCRKTFNVEKIEIDDVKSSLNGEPVAFQLHGEVMQLSFQEFKDLFGLSLTPTNTNDFTPADLDFRIRELKIITVMDKSASSTSEFKNIDLLNNVFVIDNPADVNQPIWKITCINPLSAADRSRNARFRIYLPNDASGIYNDDCLWVDIPILINENSISHFDFKVNHGIITNMVVNNQTIGSSVHKQELNSNAYELLGYNGQTPTYTTVKWFAEVNSAKTLGTDGVTRSDFFKVRLTNTGNPKAYQMPLGDNETVSGYEIAYTENGKIMLEAINASNVYNDNDPLRIFAAVIRTNYEGFAVDSNGNAQYIYDNATSQYILNEAFTNYVLVSKTETYVEVTTEYYLENLNIYTKNEDGTETYALRNVGTGDTEQLRIKLLADNNYTLYATGYRLLADGSIDAGYYSANNGVDQVSNIKYAMKNAENSKTVKVRVDNRQDNRQYITLGTEDSFRFNATTGLWEIDIDALIDKTATNATTGAFDLSAYGVGTLEGVFKQADSTVNMKVNYAELTDFDLKTNFTEKNPDTEQDYVYHNNFILRPQITSASGIEWRASVKDGTTTISAENKFDFELEYSNDLIVGSDSFNLEKIDSSCASIDYVNKYINKIFNPENSSTIGVEWFVRFADGTTSGIEEYITVRHTVETKELEVDGEIITIKYFKPILEIKKGTKDGVNVIVTCTVGLYKTNLGYIQQMQSDLNLTLIQSEVSYELYSEKEYNENKILAVNNLGESSALIMEGGAQVNLLENLTPNSEAGLPVYTSGTNGAYNPVMDNGVQLTRRYRVISNLDTDNKLAGYCTYTIDGYQIKSVPIYFIKDGKKVYQITPSDVEDGEKELVVYSEFISTDTEAQIIISSPFGGKTATYNIIVKSSVKLISPTQNVTARTTNENEVNNGSIDSEYFGKGNIDLEKYYKAQRQEGGLWENQIVSFSLENEAYGKIEQNVNKSQQSITVKNNDGSTTNEVIKTIFYPADVYETQTVKLTMYYYLKNTDGTYTKYTVNAIDTKDIAVLVEAGYSVEINVGKNDNNIEEISGRTIDLFNPSADDENAYAKDPSKFIRITNLATNMDVPVEELIGENGLLKRLIKLEYNTDGISEELLEQLFNNYDNDDNYLTAIYNGVIKTNSINSNLEVPVIVKFKAGFMGNSEQSLGSSAVFTINFKASLLFNVSGNNVENKPYDSTEENHIIKGHTYSSVNSTISNNEYQLSPVIQTLYANGNVKNIISLLGGGGEDLLRSKFVSLKALKFDAEQEKYLDYNTSDEFAKFEVITNFDNSFLQNIVLSIKNAVNQTEHFKLEITTSYGAFNDVLDGNGNKLEYYFTLSPVIKSMITYPIETEGNERVNVNSKIDLLDSFINENNRLRLFDGSNNFYSIIKPNGGETRYAIVNNGITTYLPQGVTPFTYYVVSGPAVVNNNLIEFVNPTNTAIAVVRCVAFNGATIDYLFNVTTGSSSVIIEPKNPTIYAENLNPYNLFSEQFLTINNEPSNIKYVIKYQSISNGLYINEKTSANKVISTNQTLEYTGGINKVLNMWFDDVSNVNGVKVKFLIWHNFNVEGDSPVTLEVTLLPNLILESNNKLNTFAAGTNNVVMSNVEGDNVFIKLGNTLSEDLAKINLEVSQIKPAGEKDFRPVNANDIAKYGFNITSETSGNNKTYKLLTYNIENEIDIKLKVSKNTYFYEFDAKLKPNINFNVNYLANGNSDPNYYIFTGAAASNNLKVVTLNNVVTPRTLSGELISSSTDISFGLSFYIIENGVPNYNINHIITSTQIANNVFSFSVAAVNKEYIIYGDISIIWKSNIPNGTSQIKYTETIKLRLVPNLIESAISYSEIGVDYLNVFAGSEININFPTDLKTPVKVMQGVNPDIKSATINATQVNTSDDVEYVNVVLRAKSGSNYKLLNNKLIIDGYLNDDIIEFEVYYDLTGKLSGVIEANAGDGAPFNDPTKLYKSNHTLKIKINPSLNSITYALNEDSTPQENYDYSTSEKAYMFDFEKLNNLSITGTDPYKNSEAQANEIELTKIFNIELNSKLSFESSSAEKIFVNKEKLLRNIDYSVKAKSGINFDQLTNELTETEANNSVKFDVRNNKLFASFVLPNNVGGNVAYEFVLTITLPGVTNSNASIEMYARMEISNDRFGQIITPTPIEGDNNKTTIGWTSGEVKYVLDSNNRILLTGRSDSKQGLFRYGYLLGTSPISNNEYSNYYNSTSNVNTLKRGTQEYYIYEMNNVNFNAAIDGNINYASIVEEGGKTYLEIEPYYATDNAGSVVKRSIIVQITCGTVSSRFTFEIEPIVVDYEYSVSELNENGEIIINNKLINNENEILADSKQVSLITSGLSAEEARIVNSWLIKNGNEYKLVPNRYQICKPVTFSIQTSVTVGADNPINTQIFNGIIDNITINPYVNIEQELLEVIPNSSGENKSYNILGTDTVASFINSNIFSNTDIDNVNVTLSISNNLVDYNNYISIKNATKSVDGNNDVYEITKDSTIEIISQNLLEDIKLNFKLLANFEANSNNYSFEQNITLDINKNAGIGNLSSSYSSKEALNESDVQAKFDANAPITGVGEFYYEVTNVACDLNTGESLGVITNEEVMVTITTDANNVITMFNFNWSKLVENYSDAGIKNIREFKLTIYYKDGDNLITVKEGVSFTLSYK